MNYLNFPVGTSNFEKIRSQGYYYVDKTGWSKRFIQSEHLWSCSSHVRVAIFEAKYTKSLDQLERACDTALQQIDERMYAKEYEDDYDEILCYGISFFKKRCMVKKK